MQIDGTIPTKNDNVSKSELSDLLADKGINMETFKIDIKQVREFIKTEKVMYASDGNKKLYIMLHAEPNFKRFIVVRDGVEYAFLILGEAVKFFNAS